MADQQQQSGFRLPTPGTGTTSSSPAPARSEETKPAPGTTLQTTGETPDTSTRDMAIGGGVLLILIIGFFFAKNAYASALVSKKVAPRSADAAGWWLFILLTAVATAAVLGFVNQARFLTLLFMGPLVLIAVISLVLMVLSGRR